MSAINRSFFINANTLYLYFMQNASYFWLIHEKTRLNLVKIRMVSRWGFEPQTLWLKVKCSTDWASGTKEWLPWMDSNHRNVRDKVWCLTTWLQGNTEMVVGHGFEPWNPKEQIYSLPRLTTSLSLHKKWCRLRESNPQPTDSYYYSFHYHWQMFVVWTFS